MKDEAPPSAEASAASEREIASASESKARKTLDERIEETEAALKRLREAKRQKEKEDRERNERELNCLLAAEKLNLTPAAVWRKAIPDIKAALKRAGN